MPELPHLNGPAVPPSQAAGVQIGTPSNRGAAAIAGSLGSVVDEASEIQMDLLENQSKIDVLSQESKYGDLMAETQEKFDRNSPADWPIRVKEASKGFLDDITQQGISPAAKKELQLRLGDYERKVLRQVGRDARLAQIGLIKDEYDNRKSVAFENGEFDAARDNLMNSASALKMTDPEIDRALIDIDRRERDFILESARSHSPMDLLKSLKSGEFSLNKLERQREIKLAERELGFQRREKAQTIVDQIYSGEITTDEGVEEKSQDLRPKTISDLKDLRAKIEQRNIDGVRLDPRVQSQMLESAHQAISLYDPNPRAAEYDSQLVAIENMMAGIEPSPARRELERRLKKIRNDEFDKVDDIQSFARSQLDSALNIQRKKLPEKGKPVGKSIRSLLDDGILTDADKLKRAGFSEEVIEQIVEAANNEREAKAGGKTHEGAKSVDLLRLHWSGSNAADEDFPSIDLAALRAIRNGKGPSHMVVDPDAQTDYEKTLERSEKSFLEEKGRIRQEFYRWLEVNPEAKPDEVSNKIKELTRASKGQEIKARLITEKE